MPQVNRAVAPARNGSILSRGIPVEQLEETYIKIVLYGQNRVGKTTLACDFPKPLLLISFEPNKTGGAQSVKKIPGVTYLKLTSTRDSAILADELSRGAQFKTHVLDTATSLQDLVLQELMDLSAIPEMLNWGLVSMDTYRERSEKTRELLRPFLNLNAHTVICAKERDHNSSKDMRPKIVKRETIESYLASDLGGATVGWLHDACDYIARLYLDKETIMTETEVTINKQSKIRKEEVETGKIVRRLRTMYHPNYAAGFRSCTPERVPEFIEAPTFAKILKVIKGE